MGIQGVQDMRREVGEEQQDTGPNGGKYLAQRRRRFDSRP